ncbi:MAG: DsbA family protein [Hyphomonadaceae bacterium]
MTLAFDFYFSFRSPYSYLATPQIAALLDKYDLHAEMKVVRPIAVRIPGFFQKVNPLWPPYLARDCKRVAEMNGVPYRWPRPDPIVQDRETREVAADQPYIYRVSRMGVAASRAGKGPRIRAPGVPMMWSGETDNWHQGDHLANCLREVGLNPETVEADIGANPDPFDAHLAANEQAQTDAGHWGVPLFVFNGEPFFGQDRIDALLWRMKQSGLTERGPTGA